MPEPTVTRTPTPPGSVIVVRVAADEADDTLDLAGELHRQTGLPVVVVAPGADLSVTTPDEAEAALDAALNVAADLRLTLDEVTGAGVLHQLTEDGWALVRVRP